ncbi:MAG TPA: ABC transporter substrate-binding protein, partial [Burkholderiales bacterium]|nr:ABC transporter substrate-binding protein [Burkholderiales bacterium]
MPTRRTVVLAFSAGILIPAAALGQAGRKVWRIGFIFASSRERVGRFARDQKFVEGMRELGYVKDRDYVTEWRFGDGSYDRLPALAEELVALKVDIIVAGGSPAIRAVQQATKTIPIVMTNTGDPVGSGFAASLARPGGNITGMSNSNNDVSPKYLELLMALVPKLQRVAVLGNPGSSTHPAILKTVQTAAQSVRVSLVRVDARKVQEIENAFATMVRERVDALIVVPEPLLNQQAGQIAELAAKHRIPAVYGGRESVEAGGLIGYGPNLIENWRRAATYVDKIFKGAKPGDLPIQQPTQFELVINRKAARALGLT